MTETPLKGPVSSGESVSASTAEFAPTPEEFSETKQGGESWTRSLRDQTGDLLEYAKTNGYPLLVECAKFLKRTRKVWLIAAGTIVGVIALVNLTGIVSERARNARERRYEQAVASVTPERLIARCGQPAKDVTTEVYPVLMRTMSYERAGSPTLVLKFSRTAEEKSDWVFLALNDESGTRTYDSPDAEIAALPCLNSKK